MKTTKKTVKKQLPVKYPTAKVETTWGNNIDPVKMILNGDMVSSCDATHITDSGVYGDARLAGISPAFGTPAYGVTLMPINSTFPDPIRTLKKIEKFESEIEKLKDDNDSLSRRETAVWILTVVNIVILLSVVINQIN